MPPATTKREASTSKQSQFDPLEGSTHPKPAPMPPGIANATSAQPVDLGPALRWMRGEMVREFIRLLRRRNKNAKDKGGISKRKAALAMSAAVMSMSTAAVDADRYADRSSAVSFMDATQMRVDVARLSASEAMKEALAEEEGVRLTVYRDVAGYPTVGVGHLVTPADGLKVGDTISYERALDLLEKDLKTAEKGVKRLVGDLPLYQHEFDALVDLVYNVGEGNVSPDESPMLNEAIAQRNHDAIAAELDYRHAAGSVAKGLIYRSERRAAIFMEAAYDDPRPIEISVSDRTSA